MSRRRKRQFGRYDPDLPKMEPLNGPVVGARLLGARLREEGVIAHGASSERWRLTDDIDSLLLGNDHFVMGTSLREVKEALEAQYLSPVPGVSMIEICNSHDLKRHTMPFADSVLRIHKKNPSYSAQCRWGDKYIKVWVPDPIEKLMHLCVTDDLLISAETEEYIREEDDFYTSDLVIGRRDTWYSIVKYRPSKAKARRKTVNTITKNAQHAADLVAAARDLRAAAADAYRSLRGELEEFDVHAALVQISDPGRHNHYQSYQDPDTMAIVREVKALVRIHAALRGRHAHRHNADWQEFLKAVRDRPKDLGDDTWGNYHDVREWLAAECRLRKLKPTPKMLAARAAAEAAELQARTCAECGAVAGHTYEMSAPPQGCQTEYASGAKLCGDCWGSQLTAIDAANERRYADAAI